MAPKTEQPFRISMLGPMQVTTSNVGCWRFQGTATTTTTTVSGPVVVASATSRSTVSGTSRRSTCRRRRQSRLQPVHRSQGRKRELQHCRLRQCGGLLGERRRQCGDDRRQRRLADRQLRAADAALPDRHRRRQEDAAGDHHLQLPRHRRQLRRRRTGELARVPDPGATISGDGQTIAGTWNRIDSDGAKTTVWNLQSLREP